MEAVRDYSENSQKFSGVGIETHRLLCIKVFLVCVPKRVWPCLKMSLLTLDQHAVKHTGPQTLGLFSH